MTKSTFRHAAEFMAKLAVIAIALTVVFTALFTWPGFLSAGADQPTADDLGQRTCDAAFGSDAEYGGYIGSAPPAVSCELPNGDTGVTPMPDRMREALGIQYHNATVRLGESFSA